MIYELICYQIMLMTIDWSLHCIIIVINCNFMLKLLQYYNYIILVMQIKLMLLLAPGTKTHRDFIASRAASRPENPVPLALKQTS